ncbi:Tautomerase enzyme [Rhizobium halophytocola]|uniref:Tautomerase enzyme n=1 Tax=Rhizobium halophytocola TaxID=735519 RepID=A0ABS4E3T1_9HYPH|nr:Tautomerase enzyme [Rhizobium halophytocola]MBP1852594.1 hypothetical protein [Rhizobium halophytocola]
MPIQVIVSQALLSVDAEATVLKQLTDLLLDLHGLADNGFMPPNVLAELIVVPRGRTVSAGQPADIAVFELTVPSFVLPTPELKRRWISEGTEIIERAAAGRLPRARIFANIKYAVDGGWGIAGIAYDNEGLGAAIAAAA